MAGGAKLDSACWAYTFCGNHSVRCTKNKFIYLGGENPYIENVGIVPMKRLAGKPIIAVDFTVTKAIITASWGPWEKNKGGIEISWRTKSAGFGQLIISLTNDYRVVADTENMDKDFCKEVIKKLEITDLQENFSLDLLAKLTDVDRWDVKNIDK